MFKKFEEKHKHCKIWKGKRSRKQQNNSLWTRYLRLIKPNRLIERSSWKNIARKWIKINRVWETKERIDFWIRKIGISH